jgi:hypothetical protein
MSRDNQISTVLEELDEDVESNDSDDYDTKFDFIIVYPNCIVIIVKIKEKLMMSLMITGY